MSEKIRVLVVDDSSMVRSLLRRRFAREADIEVVGEAGDPYEARDRIAELRPDVLTLDVAMPRMDGLTFLERLMQALPLPVVVLSSLTPRCSENAARALSLGAVDVIAKPQSSAEVESFLDAVVSALRVAKSVRLQRPRAQATPVKVSASEGGSAKARLVAIGASTGGPQALETIVSSLGPSTPPMVAVLHMPAAFTRAYAERLDRLSSLQIREAREGDRLQAGTLLIAPGDRHCQVRASGAQLLIALDDGPKVNLHRPSIDVLLLSVAAVVGSEAMGILLTGMGSDGALGLLEMRRRGAETLVQDEATSLVYGIPRSALEMGAAQRSLPLESIARAIVHPSAKLRRSLPHQKSP